MAESIDSELEVSAESGINIACAHILTILFRVLMDNFSPEQYDRYEAYRRNALPKQGVRRVSYAVWPNSLCL